MPTGYTSDLYERDITMREYVLTCARAFGACASIRDNALNTDIPEFVVDTYHQRKFKEAQSNLNKYSLMNMDEVCKQMEEEKQIEIENILASIEKQSRLEERYNKMLSSLVDWYVETDYDDLKKFAINQIHTAKEFDCSGKWHYERLKKLKTDTTTPEIWISNKLTDCIKDMKYHSEEYEKDVKRVERNNNWVRKLKESL